MKKNFVLAIALLTATTYAMEDSGNYVELVQSIDETSASFSEEDNGCTIAEIDDARWKAHTDKLDFADQQLSSITGFRLKCMPSSLFSMPLLFPHDTLTTLILKKNFLSDINASELSGLSNLRHLDISENQLTSIDLGALFNACNRLKYIDASHNQINKVAWSKHPVWAVLKSAHNSEPAINLVGNIIGESDRQWMRERYEHEQQRLSKSKNVYESVVLAMLRGGVTVIPIVLLAGIATGSGYSALAIPIGGSVGGAIGCIANECELRSFNHKMPLFFEEKDFDNEKLNGIDAAEDVYQCRLWY